VAESDDPTPAQLGCPKTIASGGIGRIGEGGVLDDPGRCCAVGTCLVVLLECQAYAYDAAATGVTRSGVCSLSAAFRDGYKFTGKERDAESRLDNFVPGTTQVRWDAS